ncbi:MAG: hypothetical protein ABFS45_00200 [Pseudomonadota bacterium]
MLSKFAVYGVPLQCWLETDWVLSQFAKRLKTCRQRYEAFVRAGKEEGYRPELHHGGEDGRVLAGKMFVRHLARSAVSMPPSH